MELILSASTVILAVLAIIIYIYYQGSLAFYAAVALTIIIGYMNLRMLSKEEEAVAVETQKGAPARRPQRNGGRNPKPKAQ